MVCLIVYNIRPIWYFPWVMQTLALRSDFVYYTIYFGNLGSSGIKKHIILSEQPGLLQRRFHWLFKRSLWDDLVDISCKAYRSGAFQKSSKVFYLWTWIQKKVAKGRVHHFWMKLLLIMLSESHATTGLVYSFLQMQVLLQIAISHSCRTGSRLFSYSPRSDNYNKLPVTKRWYLCFSVEPSDGWHRIC